MLDLPGNDAVVRVSSHTGKIACIKESKKSLSLRRLSNTPSTYEMVVLKKDSHPRSLRDKSISITTFLSLSSSAHTPILPLQSYVDLKN